MCLQGQWQCKRCKPGEAHHSPLPRGEPAFHHHSLLQVSISHTHTTLMITFLTQSSHRTPSHGVNMAAVSHRALAACSKDGADPYVSFILLPDKKATTKRRTGTKKRDLNPEFNERQEKTMRDWWQWKKQWTYLKKNVFYVFFSLGLILISLWRSAHREDWTCLWRTVFPSWAERGSWSAR